MKKILVSIFLLYLFYPLWSHPIDSETAKKVAKNFISQRRNTTNEVLNVVTEKMNGESSFYVVNFHEGGWVMVSADDSAVPVLSYNLYGEFKLEDEKPEAFIELTSAYKEQIAFSKTLEFFNSEISLKWESLISGNILKSLKAYTPGVQLLDVPGRGHVQWRQGSNNSGGCTP